MDISICFENLRETNFLQLYHAMQLKNWTNRAIFKLRLGNVKQKWREVHDDVYPLSSLLRKYYFIETLSLPHTKKSTWYFLSFLTRNTSSIVLSSSLQQLISCYFFLQVQKFFNPSLEDKVVSRIVLPPLNDDIQLSVEEYRFKLYEIIQKDKAR